MPISTLLEVKRAQSSLPAADVAAVVDIPDSSEETRGAELVQPCAKPVPYPHPKPESYAVMGGTFRPDMPLFVDLGGDPNMVSSEFSPSSEEPGNFIHYSTDPAPSPSHTATSEVCAPPPLADSRESMGQDDIAGEPVTAAAVQHLREEEEDNIEELPCLATGVPSAGLHGTGSTSTPLDSQ